MKTSCPRAKKDGTGNLENSSELVLAVNFYYNKNIDNRNRFLGLLTKEFKRIINVAFHFSSSAAVGVANVGTSVY